LIFERHKIRNLYRRKGINTYVKISHLGNEVGFKSGFSRKMALLSNGFMVKLLFLGDKFCKPAIYIYQIV